MDTPVASSELTEAGRRDVGTLRGAVLVVTGDTFIGLAIIRSLGRRGLRVLAASSQEAGLGPYSRYCAGSFRLPRAEGALVDGVLAIIDAQAVTHMIATSEDLIVLFNEHRSLLEPRVRLLFPPREVFDLALYKDRTLTLARELGIPLPRTERVARSGDVERCRTMRFPVVLKPRHRDRRQGAHRVLSFKVDYAQTYGELVDKLRPFADPGEYPLVQEYWGGAGIGVELLMRQGRPILTFQHRRIREYPPTGGVSVYCESTPVNPTLLDYSARLLAAMGWDGVAMVEFRDDPARGPALMEVNGRFWGSLPLALHAGADFPYWLYRSFPSDAAAAGPPLVSVRIGVRCRSIAGDTKWLAGRWWEGGRARWGALAAYLAAFRPGVKYYGWALDDPLPALMNTLLRVRQGVAGTVPRWLARGGGHG